MRESEISAFPELICQARERQLQAKSDVLDLKRQYDNIRNNAYLAAVAEGKGHYHASAIAALNDAVVSAKTQLELANLRLDEARLAANRLEDTFHLSLALLRNVRREQRLKVA